MSIIKLKIHRMPVLVFIIGVFVLGFFVAAASLPTVFWNVRPEWLNTVEVKAWIEQSEPLSQSQLRILSRIIKEDYYPQGMIGGYAVDALWVHMNHQEDSIVSILVNIMSNHPDAWTKTALLPLLSKVSSKYESQAVTIFRRQLLNNDHTEARSAIICYSIDGLFKFDPIASRDIIERFTEDSDSKISSHTSYILGKINMAMDN